jgi:hypothetical protein
LGINFGGNKVAWPSQMKFTLLHAKKFLDQIALLGNELVRLNRILMFLRIPVPFPLAPLRFWHYQGCSFETTDKMILLAITYRSSMRPDQAIFFSSVTMWLRNTKRIFSFLTPCDGVLGALKLLNTSLMTTLFMGHWLKSGIAYIIREAPAKTHWSNTCVASVRRRHRKK